MTLEEAAQYVRDNCYQTTAVENLWSYGPVIAVDPMAYFALMDALEAGTPSTKGTDD